jgi:TM2 domain/Prokaryotic RING finger family 1
MSASVCPYCRAPVDAETGQLLCAGCGTPHHEDCYAENGGCTIFGCRCAPPEEPKVAVSAPELMVARMPGVAGASALPGFAGATQGNGASTATGASSAIFGAHAANADAKRKITFIMLGLFLGAVGGHNFYAGYTSKAVIQLCLTVLTIGYGAPMTWIWAVIEICIVDRDSKGVQFSS